jgi:hypothetical protein
MDIPGSKGLMNPGAFKLWVHWIQLVLPPAMSGRLCAITAASSA